VTELHRAVAGDGGDPHEAARAMKAAIDAVVPSLASREWRGEDLRAMLAGLVSDGLAGQYRDYAGAEQATMAIGSLLAYLARRGELPGVRSANAALDRLHATVKDDEKYRPERFRAALEDLGRSVAR
jgi:hypothetical protein